MKKIVFFFTVFYFFLSQFSYADHIVGGELQMLHKSGENYSISLNFYFNDITGDPLAKDPYEYVTIFKKSDNSLVQTILLNLDSDNFIPNIGGGACTNGNVRTRLIRYTTDITLSSSIY